MEYFSRIPYKNKHESLTPRLHRQTYQCLRLVMASVAIILPILLLVSSEFLESTEAVGAPPGSISAYYHTEMRNVFVGSICAIGMCLYAYKGYNNLENTSLTVAGLFLFGVALAPTNAPPESSPFSMNWDMPILHYVCAASFFLLIAIVCIFARDHGLQTMDENNVSYDRSFSNAYNLTATLMILILLIGGGVWLLNRSFPGTTLFWLEAFAIWVFAGYWIVKTRELNGLE
ncbi:MAG: hypothetical protein HUJ26_03950 [Planctomycetaceae bacterium]|nr:hypothetical protein [Planctomycetaceae bacterium]